MLDEIGRLEQRAPVAYTSSYAELWALMWVVYGFAAEYEDHPGFCEDFRPNGDGLEP